MGPQTHSLLLNRVKQTYITPHNIFQHIMFLSLTYKLFGRMANIQKELQNAAITEILESRNVLIFVLLK